MRNILGLNVFYSYSVQTSQYVEPSYVPDPVLFGLDTPPWMPREDNNDVLLQRSKDVLESLNNYDPFGRPRTQTKLKEKQDSQDEKKDSEKESAKSQGIMFLLRIVLRKSFEHHFANDPRESFRINTIC